MAADSETERPASAGRLPRDFAIGFVILALTGATYWITFGISEAPAALAQNVQPATFPRMVLLVIAVLTVLMVILGLGQKDMPRKAPKLVMLATGALMIAFTIAFEALGPMAAMILFCLTMPILWGARPSVKLVIYALAFPFAVFLIFDVGLGVYFPPGAIETFLKGLL